MFSHVIYIFIIFPKIKTFNNGFWNFHHTKKFRYISKFLWCAQKWWIGIINFNIVVFEPICISSLNFKGFLTPDLLFFIFCLFYKFPKNSDIIIFYFEARVINKFIFRPKILHLNVYYFSKMRRCLLKGNVEIAFKNCGLFHVLELCQLLIENKIKYTFEKKKKTFIDEKPPCFRSSRLFIRYSKNVENLL